MESQMNKVKWKEKQYASRFLLFPNHYLTTSSINKILLSSPSSFKKYLRETLINSNHIARKMKN